VSTVETIERKLTAALSPTRLTIVDESARHLGHVGARPEGETHFRVDIVAPAFEGRSRLDRHRMVSDILADELAGRVHALSLSTRAPSEDGGH
jgi:BolA family transcriptional regulator, general stress-responsive regulator